MSYAIVKNNTKEELAPASPYDENGNLYTMWLVDARNPKNMIFASSEAELVNSLCGENYNQTREEALMKLGFAAVYFSKKKLKQAISKMDMEVAEWEANIIRKSLDNVESCVYGWGNGDSETFVEDIPTRKQEVRDTWSCPVPLVLFELHYYPFTGVNQPESLISDVRYPRNLFWVRVSNDKDCLESLKQIGMINFDFVL